MFWDHAASEVPPLRDLALCGAAGRGADRLRGADHGGRGVRLTQRCPSPIGWLNNRGAGTHKPRKKQEVNDDADGIPVTGPSTYFYQKDIVAQYILWIFLWCTFMMYVLYIYIHIYIYICIL